MLPSLYCTSSFSGLEEPILSSFIIKNKNGWNVIPLSSWHYLRLGVQKSAPGRISMQKVLFYFLLCHFKQRAGLPCHSSTWAPLIQWFQVGWKIPVLKPLHWFLFSATSMMLLFGGVKLTLCILPAPQRSGVYPPGHQSRIWPCYLLVSFLVYKFCLL